MEEIMRSKKQDTCNVHEKKAWYNDQKCISVHRDVHNKINHVRNEYVKRYHRNITLGYIVEMLLSHDEIITGIYNEILQTT